MRICAGPTLRELSALLGGDTQEVAGLLQAWRMRGHEQGSRGQGVLDRGESLCKIWKGASAEEFGDLEGILLYSKATGT